MKLLKPFLSCLLLVPSLLVAQKTVYFNSDWLLSDKSEASYYSTIYPAKDLKYEVKDYTISGILLSSTEYRPKSENINWERIYELGFHDSAIEDGTHVEFYPNGKKKRLFTYVNGNQSGKIKEWNNDGNILREYMAENNLANGLYLEFYKNGTSSLSVTFKNDTLNGPAVYYHLNGSISQKGSFKSGKKIGRWTYWNDKNDLIGTESYRESFFIAGPDFTIHFPGGNWCLSDQFKKDEMMNFIFTRNGDLEKLKSGVAPTLIISLEYVGKDANLLDYSSFRRRRLSVDIHKVISKDQDLFSLSNSMGYLGSYVDEKGKKHTSVVLHSIQKSIGIEMILDIRTEDYESLKKEAVYILRSLKN